MNDDNALYGFIAILGLCGICFFVGCNIGHTAGVKDHADKKYVVVDLPDGSRVVVKVKEQHDDK